MSKRVVVIGAGPGGLMAAGQASGRGNDVILLEKNDGIGKKILLTGKGRCNITNTTDVEGLIQNTPGNGSFLYSVFYTFSNQDLIGFLEGLGLKTKEERGGRVFPVSDRAGDVNSAFLRFLKNTDTKLKLNSPAKEIETKDGRVQAVVLKDGRRFLCESVIIATGGLSYPGTGSTGDGYSMARALGHTIVKPRPSLVPLITEESWPTQLSGLSLKNVSISVKNKIGKELYKDFGEMLFTHFGVSGPIILSSGRHMLEHNYKGIKLLIDLKPALSMEKLDERIRRDFEKYSRKQFRNSLNDILPKKMIAPIINLSGIDPNKPVNQINKDERWAFVKTLKNLTLTIKDSRPIREAIVTAGGVCTDEINPSTMESKLIKGLYFAGEVIDVDAYTGGFNLTIAFSTGYCAGTNC